MPPDVLEIGPIQGRDKGGHIGGQRAFELEPALCGRMMETQPGGVQGLTAHPGQRAAGGFGQAAPALAI